MIPAPHAQPTDLAPTLGALGAIEAQGAFAAFVENQDIKASSKATYARALRQYWQWLQSKGLSLAIERTDLLTYKADLLAQGLSPLTVAAYLVTVRKFYSWTEAQKIYPNIANGIKTPRRKQAHKKQHLTAGRAADLLGAIEGTPTALRDKAIINLMLRTGLRTIEVSRLDIGDITYKANRRVLMIWGKGHDSKDDYVVLTNAAYGPIAAYIAAHRRGAKGNAPLFVSTSNNSKGERISTRTISGLCKRALRAIGLDGHEFTAHSLRHTTAVAILKAGGNIEAVATVLRHRQITTSQVYVESVKEELRLQNSPESLLDTAFDVPNPLPNQSKAQYQYYSYGKQRIYGLA